MENNFKKISNSGSVVNVSEKKVWNEPVIVIIAKNVIQIGLDRIVETGGGTYFAS